MSQKLAERVCLGFEVCVSEMLRKAFTRQSIGLGEAGEIAQGGIDIHGLNDLLTFGFFFMVGMVKRVVVPSA